MNKPIKIENPFRPGAGHFPPFFAGRSFEQKLFAQMLIGTSPLNNILIGGDHGFGKTALMEQFKKQAHEAQWICVTNELSKSSTINEERLYSRIILDLAEALSDNMEPCQTVVSNEPRTKSSDHAIKLKQLVFQTLQNAYENADGNQRDKLRIVLEKAGALARNAEFRGILIAYDEAQYLIGNESHKDSLIEKLYLTVSATQNCSGISPSLLLLSGFKKEKANKINLGENDSSLTHTIHLNRLSLEEAWLAISKPISQTEYPLDISPELPLKAAKLSGGHPFLVQVLGKELTEQYASMNGQLTIDSFPTHSALERIETGFFAVLWNKTNEEQQDLLRTIIRLSEDVPSFSKTDVSKATQELAEGKSSSETTHRLLEELTKIGMLYRFSRDRYAFTVPMSELMIKRRLKHLDEIEDWNQPASTSPLMGTAFE